MNQPIKLILGGAIFCLPMLFTSCGNIDNPLEELSGSVPSTVVEEVKVLGEALEAGATVTINYTVGTESYTATFQKNSDDTYTLISNTAAPATTRAMTRSSAPTHNVPTGDGATIGSNIKLELVGNKLVLTVKSTDGISLFEAQMNVDGGEVIVFNTNAGNLDCTIGAVSINEQKKDIKNPKMHSVIIKYYPIQYAVKYSEGETWADVVDRYKNNESMEITTTTDGYISVKFSKEIVVEAFMTDGASEEEAENNYNTYFSGSFYLTERGLNARAMTRAIDPPTYVKATDAVDAHDTYYLIPVPVALSAVSTSHISWVIGSDGKAYADIYYIPDGTTAVATITYVGDAGSADASSTTYKGLALAMSDASTGTTWCLQTNETCLTNQYDNADDAKGDMAGISNTEALHNNNEHAHNAAFANGSDHPTGTSDWFLPSAGQWDKMVTAAGGYNYLKEYAELQSGDYWSSTEHSSNSAWILREDDGSLSEVSKNGDRRVRACLAF